MRNNHFRAAIRLRLVRGVGRPNTGCDRCGPRGNGLMMLLAGTCPEMTRNLPSRTNRPSFLPAQVERNSEVYELPIVRPLACVLRGTRGTEEKHFKNQNSCRVLRAFPDYLGGSFAAHRSEQPRNFRAMLRTHPDCEERKVASRRVADEDMCALEEVQLSESTVKRWPRPRR